MAIMLAAEMPDAGVVVLVEDDEVWRDRIDGLETAPKMVSRFEELADPEVLLLTPERLLRDELAAEAARWPQHVPSILGELARDDAGQVVALGLQSASVQSAVEAIAAAAPQILNAGNLTTSNCLYSEAENPLLTPSELRAMAEQILDALKDTPSSPTALSSASTDSKQMTRHSADTGAEFATELFLRALEMASRLPTIAARAGWTPRRPRGYVETVPGEVATRLAERAHTFYLGVAARTENATESELAERRWSKLSHFDKESNRAQVVDIPVKLAAIGMDWRRSDSPTVVEFSAETIEKLAELEHRRWEFFQRRNGRPGHRWAVAWQDLPDGVREYDREPMRQIPTLLASINLEVAAVEATAHDD